MQLSAQAGRLGVTAARKCPHDNPLGRVEFPDHLTGHMPQATGHSVPIHSAAHRLRHDETHARSGTGGDSASAGMHDKIRLRGSHSAFHGVAEVRRPCHPVSSREHWSATGESGSQRTAALAAAAGDDGAAGAGPHPQPETMDPGPTPVVRLEGALALGHDCLSSSLLAATIPKDLARPFTGAAVAKALSNRRGPESPVAAVPPTFGRLFEGTEVACAGQTAPERATRTTVPTGLPTCWHPAGNLLASPQSTER